MDWIQKRFKSIIYICFLVPILLVAFVSISHVTTWYQLSNPQVWAIYLSVGIEIAALSALAAISAQMGRKVYLPFTIVTIIQFIGNIFFAYQFIDVNSEQFKDWVDLVDPVVSYLGVESGSVVGHKRFLSLFSGGMLPIISLSFLHMLVKFEEDEKNKKIESSVTIDEEMYKPTEDELNRLEEYLRNINEKKFGTLNQTEKTSEDSDFDESANSNEKPIEQFEIESQPEVQNNDDFPKIVESETHIESNEVIEEKIEVEPDFYKEEIPDYHIDEETGATVSKRLNYFRSR